MIEKINFEIYTKHRT